MLRLISYGVAALGAVYFSKSFLSGSLVPQTQSADPSSVTLQEVQKLGELTTIRLPVQVVVPAIATREVLGFPQQTKVLYVAQVYVTAGIDMSGAIAEGNTITLPAPKILDSKVDVDKSTVFDTSKDILAPDSFPELIVQAQQESLKAGVVAACNSGVLAQSGVQAKVVIGAIAVGRQVVIAKPTGCFAPKA